MLKIHIISLIIIFCLVAIASIVYFYLQQLNEKAALDSLLAQHIALQKQSGESIANGISSDLSSLMDMMQNVAHIESEKEKWPDYSSVDGIIAVREFGPQTANRKPATKLYNSWLAGVPAILGAESAFRFEGNPGEDYLEVTSMKEVFQSIESLMTDVNLRMQLVSRGFE